jgi:DNA mismatch endonuclease (patch repair protein)
MRGNRRANTRPEIAVRAELHRRGFRFRKDYFLPIRGARGVRVDIVFTRVRVAVFIDGCFWHGCPDHGHAPRRNTGYWEPKLTRNRARDALVSERLVDQGWRVVRVWEHTPPAEAADLVASSVSQASEGYD